METILFKVIILIIISNFLLDRFLNYLNERSFNQEMPIEAEGIYDKEKYIEAARYHKVNNRFSTISVSFSLIITLFMLFLDGFAFIDQYVRTFTQNPVWIAILFFGILGIASNVISTPFELYNIFVIEENFGFNKMNIKTYLFDKLKGWFLAAFIGGGLISLFVWIFTSLGDMFWLYTWLAVVVIMVLASMFYASWILPIFNKLTPLQEGELLDAIETYCNKVNFNLTNVYIMDGSKRSTKANAFFSGLGSKKKIVLFDTLIEKHSTKELVAILAHEIGHYKKKHTFQGIVISILQIGLMLYLLSFFIQSPSLSGAIGAKTPSFHMGILAFGLLYSPLSLLLGVIMNFLSRKNEYEADLFAKNTYDSEFLISALKKLSVDNLSNLTPHPSYVFFHYSHPPLLNRIKALKN